MDKFLQIVTTIPLKLLLPNFKCKFTKEERYWRIREMFA